MWALAGETREARNVLGQLPANPEESFSKLGWLLRRAIDGQNSHLRELLDDPDFAKTLRRDPQTAYFAASALALAGEKTESMKHLRQALDGGFKNHAWLSRHDPYLTRYLDDPEYQAILLQVRKASE